jgi:hypothetical protein
MLMEARKSNRLAVLLYVLISKGRWEIEKGQVTAARTDLEEGREIASIRSYRIFEVKCLFALSNLEHRFGDKTKAEDFDRRASAIVKETGCNGLLRGAHWAN